MDDLVSFLIDMKKRGTPPVLVKSHSNASASGDKYRHLEDDVVTLSHMSDLAKTITVPHQVTILLLSIDSKGASECF
jgi:hypothetical protein